MSVVGLESFIANVGLMRRADRQQRGFKPNKQRTLDIIRYHIDGNCTLQQTGNHFDITRERVRQILSAAGIAHRTYGRLTTADHQQRYDAYVSALESGLTANEARRSLGFDIQASRAVLGLPTPDARKRKRDRMREIAAFYAEHTDMNGMMVAEHLGVPQSLVSRALLYAGMRSKGRPHRRKVAP